MLVRILLGITVALTFFVILACAADARTACKPSAENDHYYSYRIIDGKRCWYKAERGERLDKDELFWRKPKVIVKPKEEPVKVAEPVLPVFPPPIEDIEAYIIASHLAVIPQPTIAVETQAHAAVEAPTTVEFDPVFVERWAPATVAGVVTGAFRQAEVRATPPPLQPEAPIFLLTFAWAVPALGFWGVMALKDHKLRLKRIVPKGWVPVQLKMIPVA